MAFPRVLVDTDVLIDFLRKKERAKLLLTEAMQTGDLFCSVVTLAELIAGMRPAEKKTTEELISGLTFFPVNEAIARRAGHFRQTRDKKILLPDCLIAATAVEEQCVLLTFNQKDYPFDGLKLYPL